MKKIIGIVCLLGIGCVLFYFSQIRHEPSEEKTKEYPNSPLTLVIDWDIEKPFVFQVFYTVEGNTAFSEEYSVRKSVTPEDKHIEIVIPEDKIYDLRFDFGSNPGHIVLYNVELKADTYLNFNNWNNYTFYQIDKHKVLEDGSLKLYSTQGDPYMIFKLSFVFYKTNED